MDITLTKDSIVNEQTGQVDSPTEYVDNLRAIERDITRADDEIVSLKADLKTARDARETLVARLRGAVREGKVLPLFELEAEEDGPHKDYGVAGDPDPEM